MNETELELYETVMELLHCPELADLAEAMEELEAEAEVHCVLGLDGKGWRLTVEPRPDGEERRSLHIMRTRRALSQFVGQGLS